LLPARDELYRDLVARFRADDEFAALVAAVANGLDLVVLEVSDRTGIVVASTEESVFAVTMTEYAKRTGGTEKAAERVLHALAHLGVAALAYPRPADLADDGYIGRVSVEGVDGFVREAAARLSQQASEVGENADPPVERPDLETAWRVYTRRARTGATDDGRRLPASTLGIASRAMRFLADQGLLVKTDDAHGGTYRTTPRYQVQVREAGSRMFDELVRLDIGEIPVPGGSVVRLSWTEPEYRNGCHNPRHPSTARRRFSSRKTGQGTCRSADRSTGTVGSGPCDGHTARCGVGGRVLAPTTPPVSVPISKRVPRGWRYGCRSVSRALTAA
jgi:hypothetical protein